MLSHQSKHENLSRISEKDSNMNTDCQNLDTENITLFYHSRMIKMFAIGGLNVRWMLIRNSMLIQSLTKEDYNDTMDYHNRVKQIIR